MISSGEIKAFASELGFDAVGVVGASTIPEADQTLREWIKAGFHGEMKYLEAYEQRLARLRSAIPNARSIIVLGVNYFTAERSRPLTGQSAREATNPSEKTSLRGRVARYAWGKDYHLVIKEKLRIIESFIKAQVPEAHLFSCVDTQPLFERSYAQRAGLGFRGKQTHLLSREFGPWLFLSEIITDLELASDEPQDHGSCGTCTTCIERCPTQAILSSGKIDARRCIAYLTIEYKGIIPRDIRPLIRDWVFGCDECLNVCPFTHFSKETTWEEFRPQSGAGRALDLLSLFAIKTNGEYKKKFAGTALLRATRKMMLRNAAVILGNRADEKALPTLISALQEEGPLVRIHAAWALGRIGGGEAIKALHERLGYEKDVQVREEILQALDDSEVRVFNDGRY